MSKIIRTLQIATFVVLSYLATGNYVVSAFAIILYFFMTDFVKIALSTDNFRPSRKPDTWNVAGLTRASIVLGSLVIVESFLLLYIGLYGLRLGVADQTLYTYTFEVLFYSAMFLIFIVRERGHFWNSVPSKTLLAAIFVSIVVTTAIVTLGIPGLVPLPIDVTLFVMLCSAAFSLLLNDYVKFLLVESAKVKW